MPGEMTDKPLPLSLTFDQGFLTGKPYEQFNDANLLYSLANEFRATHAKLEAIFDPSIETPFTNQLYLNLEGTAGDNERFAKTLSRYHSHLLDLFTEVHFNPTLSANGCVVFSLPEAIVSKSDLHGGLSVRILDLSKRNPDDKDLQSAVRMLPFASLDLVDDIDRELGRSDTYRVTDELPTSDMYTLSMMSTPADLSREDAMASLGRNSLKFPSSVHAMSQSDDTITLRVSGNARSEEDILSEIRATLIESGDLDCQRVAKQQSFLLEKNNISLSSIRRSLGRMRIFDDDLANDILTAIVQGMGAWQYEIGSALARFLLQITDGDHAIDTNGEPEIRIHYDEQHKLVRVLFSTGIYYDAGRALGKRKMAEAKAGFCIAPKTRALTTEPVKLDFEAQCHALPKIRRHLEIYGLKATPIFDGVQKPIKGDDSICLSVIDYAPTITPVDTTSHYGAQTRWQKLGGIGLSAVNWARKNPTTAWTGMVAATTFLLIGGISAALLASGVGTPLGIVLTALSVDLAVGDLGLLLISSVAISGITGALTLAASKAKQASITMKGFTQPSVKPQAVGESMHVMPPARLEKNRGEDLIAGLFRHSEKLDASYEEAVKPKATPNRSVSLPEELFHLDSRALVTM